MHNNERAIIASPQSLTMHSFIEYHREKCISCKKYVLFWPLSLSLVPVISQSNPGPKKCHPHLDLNTRASDTTVRQKPV